MVEQGTSHGIPDRRSLRKAGKIVLITTIPLISSAIYGIESGNKGVAIAGICLTGVAGEIAAIRALRRRGVQSGS